MKFSDSLVSMEVASIEAEYAIADLRAEMPSASCDSQSLREWANGLERAIAATARLIQLNRRLTFAYSELLTKAEAAPADDVASARTAA